jgi:hypothetical protein
MANKTIHFFLHAIRIRFISLYNKIKLSCFSPVDNISWLGLGFVCSGGQFYW